MSGIYIHIPFCASKCSYCDFYSMPTKDNSIVRQYVDAVLSEYELRKTEIQDKIKTIYIGGGTPSQIPLPILSYFISELKSAIGNNVNDITEFTIEANPEDITPDWAKEIASLGINRASIGIQSFVDKELKIVGRRHDAEKAISAINALKNAGIAEISGDLIYGLPGQNLESWDYSLKKILDTGINHISAYSLSYEHGTKLYVQLQQGKIKPVEEDTTIAMYHSLIRKMRDCGYEHYEISNFSRPGHRAIHNSGYWNYIPYLGLGPGAHSFDGNVRRSNPANLKNYLTGILSKQPVYNIEYETDNDIINDYIITSLRKSEGLNYAEMKNLFGERPTDLLKKTADSFIKNGRLISDEISLRFTEESWLISDLVLRELIQ